MKYNLQNIATIILVIVSVLILTMWGINVFAINESTSADYSIDVPYEYPIQPGTEEWFAIESHAEKVGLCQIPEAILKEMTTDALVETIVNYPYLYDMMAFSDSHTGYTVVRNGFNGLQELENRSDGMDKLWDYYENAMGNQTNMDILYN